MIEIRTYTGDAAELASFCQRVWRGYLEGREQFPVWDERFFEWQLLASRPGGREYLVAAYDGSKLAGVLLAEPFQVRLPNRVVDASSASWLTVAPEYRGFGLGMKLNEELRRRHRERGAAFILGLVVGGDQSVAGHFWNAYSRACPGIMRRLGEAGTWARALDPKRLTAAALQGRIRFLARILGALSRVHRPVRSESVRPYQATDLEPCVAMVHRSQEDSDLGLIWTAERLALQLEHRGLPRTLVYTRAGRPAGFINYYPLSLFSGSAATIAVMDFVATAELTVSEARELLDTACVAMKGDECVLAVALRQPACRASHMIAAGFVPTPADYTIMATMADPGSSLANTRRPYLLFR